MLTYFTEGEKAMNYNIKQVADKTGLSEATLRYYDKEGLFPDLERKNSGYRTFSERELEQIQDFFGTGTGTDSVYRMF